MLPGRGSNYFHDNVHVGDVVDVPAPAGTFLIDPLATEPIVLIGAGIGVTPLVSMLEAIVAIGQQARQCTCCSDFATAPSIRSRSGWRRSARRIRRSGCT